MSIGNYTDGLLRSRYAEAERHGVDREEMGREYVFQPKTVIRTFLELFESQLLYQISFLICNRTF